MSPAPVLRAVFEGYEASEKLNETDPEDYPIWGYASWNQFRDPLAAFVGCNRDEIALLRNATEANSYIANGIDLKPGDEVLMTDQEHPGGEMPWQLRAKRYGIVVRKVTLPKPVENPAQVLTLFNDAITPRTRVLFFSHISTFSVPPVPRARLAVAGVAVGAAAAEAEVGAAAAGALVGLATTAAVGATGAVEEHALSRVAKTPPPKPMLTRAKRVRRVSAIVIEMSPRCIQTTPPLQASSGCRAGQ